MKYVIIGNSAAAIGAIEGIRSVDAVSEITVVSDEKYHTYSRPLISYYLGGKTDLHRMKYRPDDFYEKNACKLITGVKALKIDAYTKSVSLSNGEAIRYDKLLAATGSSAFVPPLKGLETVKNRFSFLTLDDALSLEKVLTSKSKVLIIGAGLIGLKCAEGIKDKVSEITVTDLSNCVLSSILDEESSLMIEKHLESSGLKLMLSDSVEHFDGNTAYFKSGKTINFDILVTAVGVRANVSLIKEAGGETSRGIVTDERMQTTITDIYAAGDCVESVDISSGVRKLVSIMPDAYLGGECAGINMAGGEKIFDDSVPMNSIGFFGLHMVTAGSYSGEIYCEREENSLKKLFYSDNRLNGFIIIGDIDKAGIYTSIVRNRTPLNSIDFDLVKKNPTLIAFESSERKAKLGGVV